MIYEKEPRQHGSLCLPKKCYEEHSFFQKNYPITTQLNRRMCSVLECCITGKDDPAIEKGYSATLDQEDQKIETRLTCLPCSIAVTIGTFAVYLVGCCITTSAETMFCSLKCRNTKRVHYSPLPSILELNEQDF